MKSSASVNKNQQVLVRYLVDRLRLIDFDPSASSEVNNALEGLTQALELGQVHPGDLPLTLKEQLDAFWNTEIGESVDSKKDEKLSEFIELLKVRGYFNGVSAGTEEYNLRMKKAVNKYTAKQNPFADMSPEEIKAKGNADMIAGNYDDAIRCYTKAIEVSLQTDNAMADKKYDQLHVYYANRAAALIELKNYSQATDDCAKSISYKPDYPKAFARLGVAHYYLNEFEKSADAYERALELDQGNEKYRQDMEDARSKAKESAKKSSKPNPFQDLMGNLGGGGNDPLSSLFGNNPQMKEMMESFGKSSGEGGDLQSAMANMAGNPQFMEIAQSFMQNPQFSNMVQGFAQQFMQGASNGQPGEQLMPDFAEMQKLFNPTLSGIDSDAIRELRESEVQSNPRMREIAEEVRVHGPGVFSKYMNDPEVMNLMRKFSGLIGKGHKQE
ncbi:small glutamine-rich tetratricopeptide repeat protein [Perkinsela sp. CCAP 1560/4]|nr:small glutamine-rich tetratricopeptide repeat protein [Perkinsela sp. CCAP 1560/4]|eukprot:KNH07121.1 small glutamine-rich tetratricopeptide repeat protein [Perkinsela sp. CCAP 1560/4]